MKKIIGFICSVIVCIGLNSCAVYTADDYCVDSVCYPSKIYDVYHYYTPTYTYTHVYYHPKKSIGHRVHRDHHKDHRHQYGKPSKPVTPSKPHSRPNQPKPVDRHNHRR